MRSRSSLQTTTPQLHRLWCGDVDRDCDANLAPAAIKAEGKPPSHVAGSEASDFASDEIDSFGCCSDRGEAAGDTSEGGLCGPCGLCGEHAHLHVVGM